MLKVKNSQSINHARCMLYLHVNFYMLYLLCDPVISIPTCFQKTENYENFEIL